MSDTGPKKRRRWGGCCCLAVLLPGVVLALVYLITLKTSADRLNAEMARLQQAGEPLTLEACLPPLAEGEDNAAGLYQEAFAVAPPAMPVTEGAAAQAKAHAAWVRQLATGHDDYFALLQQASRIPICIFQKDWSRGPALEFPEFAKLREAARALAARAEGQSQARRYDDATGSCLTSLGLAEHAGQSPTLIGFLVSSAIQSIATKQVEQVFSAGDPSLTACRALYDAYGRRTGSEAFVRALQGERAFGLTTLNAIAEGRPLPSPGSDSQSMAEFNRLVAVAPLLKPVLNQDQLTYLRLFSRNLDAARKPYREAHAEMEAVDRDAQALSPVIAPLTRMVMPVFSRAEWSAFRTRAVAGAAQIAAAAKAYKATRGQYPASLDALARDGWRLPLDVYMGQPYHYRREGPGMAVWSVGPDLADNGGVRFDPEVHRDLTGAAYDFVFRTAR